MNDRSVHDPLFIVYVWRAYYHSYMVRSCSMTRVRFRETHGYWYRGDLPPPTARGWLSLLIASTPFFCNY